MRLADLPPLLREERAVAHLLGRRAATVAIPEAARTITLAGLAALSSQRTFLVLLPTSTSAELVANDLRAYLPADEVELFPAWETLPFERVSPGVETMGRRLRVMWRLRKPERAPRFVVAGVRALSQRLGPHVEDVEPVTITTGQQVDPAELVAELVKLGYRREYLVEHRGEVSLRGSIVDVFPSTADVPVRVDLWGDEVDRLSEFSVHDQRSTADLAQVEIFPARELLPTDDVRARAAALVGAEPWGREQWERLAEGLVFDGMESWMPWLTPGEHTLVDLLDADSQVVLVEPRRMRDRASEILAEEADLAASLSKTWGAEGTEFPRLHAPFDDLLANTPAGAWTFLPMADRPETAVVEATGWGPVVGDGEGLGRRIAELLGERHRIIVAADTEGSARRLHELLLSVGLDLVIDVNGDTDLTRPGGRIVVAPLDHGFVLPAVRLAVITEADLTGRRRAHRRPRPQRRDSASFFEDLKPGDYVVHHTHGVGRYGGMVTRSLDGVDRDYLLLEYKGGDRLYIPSDQIDAVRHYTGGDAPALHRLGGSDFARTKARVKAAVREIAQELVVLYQRRVTSPGHAFAPDTPWQHEMEEAFPYVETPDQLKAIADVKADMEHDAPMDRLVCGDVGFGKTEVAIRAAFKAVQDGMQVGVLVPTTLLAQQHFATFGDRMAAYPIRVEVLSRFLTPGQAKRVVDGVASGEVDIVIGTHRLLSEDVQFKRLGLLVVDEEQRFGVSHKEAMKKLKTDVDVLTLTATPIPRTLEMSLTGIRDLTLLNTPPADRQPILTYVGEYDDRAVAEAIRRELLREGQVFFVHNRVQDIEEVAAEIRDMVPEARVTIAHGQMDEGTLEQTVVDFWEGQFDVLVCTTIIESGIDMPTVNTLVVDRADMLGLGQLHQLRGRVGRAGQRAYAYLFHPVDRVLSEDAYERLRTIGEATELGSGFKIAMRDLEIRGAGNLLGENQSGHIAAVGYDLYCQMVTEAVAELKGEELREPAEVKLDLPVDAHLPSSYVGREELRLEAYRRLATVTTEAEIADIKAEWTDRYGPPPPPAEALLAVGRLRAECHRLGIREVGVARGMVRLTPIHLKASEEVRFRRLARDGVYKPDLGEMQLRVPRKGDLPSMVVDFLRELRPSDDGG